MPEKWRIFSIPPGRYGFWFEPEPWPPQDDPVFTVKGFNSAQILCYALNLSGGKASKHLKEAARQLEELET